MNMKAIHYFLIAAGILLWSTCGRDALNPGDKGTAAIYSTPDISTELSRATATAATLIAEFNKDAAAATATARCLAAGGEIEIINIASQYLDAGLRFRVYTPPCYAEEATRSYPVLYLIHGQTFNDDQWDRLGADETASQLIAAGTIPPFIIVLPYDVSSNQPSRDHFGEALIEELLPWVDSNYRTIADREHRAVGGLSRGASWAIHLGLTHADLFGAVGGHSPPVFVEDAPKVRVWLDSIPAELMPRFWLDIGDRDQHAIFDSAAWLESLLNDRNISHEWSVFSGDHSEAYWSAHIEVYLTWYAGVW